MDRDMPALAEFQHAMGQALLARDAASRALPATWFKGDATAGLKVHRNTIVGACCAALRLSYPTIERVLGAPLFESLAADYVRDQPPTAPALDEYGEEFAGWVATRATNPDAALLRELAQYDWVFERVAHAHADQFGAAPVAQLDGGMHLHFATGLRLFDTQYAIEDLRSECARNTTPGSKRTLALWRRVPGVAVTALRAPAAAFVAALLHGDPLEIALQSATAAQGAGGDEALVASIIAQDVLQSDFARLRPGDHTHANNEHR
jgi:hypothetical protein